MKSVVFILFGIFCAVSANVLVPIIISNSGMGGGPLWMILMLYLLYPMGFVFAISGLVNFLKQSCKDDAEQNSRQ